MVKEYLVLNYCLPLSKSRSGNLPLAIETMRYKKLPIELNQCLCKYYNQNLMENDKHFLADCKLYIDERKNLFERMSNLDDTFIDQPSLVKMCNIMCRDDIQKCLAKTCYFMYKTRKENTV